MKKKKVLIVTCVHPPYVSENNGVANVIKTTYEIFKDQFDFYAFSVGESRGNDEIEIEELTYDGVKVTFLHNLSNSNQNFLFRFKSEDYKNTKIQDIFSKYLERVKPDIIHFHSINGLGANIIDEAEKRKIFTVITFHDFWWICSSPFLNNIDESPLLVEKYGINEIFKYSRKVRSIYRKEHIPEDFEKVRFSYLRKQLRKIDRIIPNSLFVHNIYKKVYPEIKMFVVENPIDLPDENIESKNIDTSKIIFGFLGGTATLKGYDTLIKAFHRINDKTIWLNIYGSPIYSKVQRIKDRFKSKPEKFRNLVCSLLNIFESLLRKYPRIHYLGLYNKENKFETINSLDVVIIGSKARESYSLTTIESMMLGKYIIVSDSGSQKNLVNDYSRAVVFKTGDAEDLYKCIKRTKKIILKGNKFNNKTINKVKNSNLNFINSFKKIYYEKK